MGLFSRKKEDNLAKRVRGTYRLDDTKFKEIIDTIDQALIEVKRTSEASPQGVNPSICPNLSWSEILIGGDYRTDSEDGPVAFDYVGRLVGGSKIDKLPGCLYLQTFKTQNEATLLFRGLTPAPHPNLFEALKDYIIEE